MFNSLGGSGELDKLLKAYRAAVVTGMANLNLAEHVAEHFPSVVSGSGAVKARYGYTGR